MSQNRSNISNYKLYRYNSITALQDINWGAREWNRILDYDIKKPSTSPTHALKVPADKKTQGTYKNKSMTQKYKYFTSRIIFFKFSFGATDPRRPWPPHSPSL